MLLSVGRSPDPDRECVLQVPLAAVRCHQYARCYAIECRLMVQWVDLVTTWAKLYCYVHTGITIFFCIISLEQTICSPSCPTTKYMTLVLKFFCCNKMTITRRRSNLFPKFRKIPEAQDLYHSASVSKHDLKPSGTSFLKICMRPWLRRLPILHRRTT